jgi:hypothetical protein
MLLVENNDQGSDHRIAILECPFRQFFSTSVTLNEFTECHRLPIWLDGKAGQHDSK